MSERNFGLWKQTLQYFKDIGTIIDVEIRRQDTYEILCACSYASIRLEKDRDKRKITNQRYDKIRGVIGEIEKRASNL